MKPISILIIDDQVLFRNGIKLALQQQNGWEVVGETGVGIEGVELAKQFKPDVLLLQMQMPDVSLIEVLHLLKENAPETRVVMLTVSEDTEDMLNTLRAGACGYLLRNTDTKSFLESIQRAARGESVMSPKMMNKLADSLRANPLTKVTESHVHADKLTPREKEVIVMIARGSRNKEIAIALNLAERTIKWHIHAILQKLHFTKRVEVALYAMESGFLSEKYPDSKQ